MDRDRLAKLLAGAFCNSPIRDKFIEFLVKSICDSPIKDKFGLLVVCRGADLDKTIQLDQGCTILCKENNNVYRFSDFEMVPICGNDSFLIKPRSYDIKGIEELYGFGLMLENNKLIPELKFGFSTEIA